ncbi:MAG: DNA-3-methyladenine glycosylase family protein, partial [Acidimicrobiales bacterium]
VDLAAHDASGTLALGRAAGMSDQEIVGHLTQVRGVGVWTAEMFLMFTLGRLDVWPVGDFGVRNGYARAWELETVPGPKQLAPLGDRFSPYRSIVAWYCWRVMDTGTPGGRQ